MKIVFFGTGKFGIPALKKLFASKHDVAAIVSQPDKPRGRGMNVQPTQVKAVAEKLFPGISVFQPEDPQEASFIECLDKQEADVFVVIDYGKILKQAVLDLPGKCSINLHPSLLPEYRGAAPVNWAIIEGQTETGNTVIKMNDKMDAGPVIVQEKIAIKDDEDAEALSARLAQNGAELVLKALDAIGAGEAKFTEQDEDMATYAPRLKKENGLIDWEKSAGDIVRLVRGTQPWPGAYTYMDGKMLKVKRASIATSCDASDSPATICDINNLTVAAGEGAVRLLEVQLEGKKAMDAAEFLRGHPVKKDAFLS